jgi:hypothetical protein
MIVLFMLVSGFYCHQATDAPLELAGSPDKINSASLQINAEWLAGHSYIDMIGASEDRMERCS